MIFYIPDTKVYILVIVKGLKEKGIKMNAVGTN